MQLNRVFILGGSLLIITVWRKSDRESYAEFVKRIMVENANFLEENFSELLAEVEGLIDYTFLKVDVGTLNKSMAFYFIAILEPLSYGVYIDLLIGNLLAFFMEFRILLESLAYCYMASKFPTDYPLDEIFKDAQASKVIEDFGEMIGLKTEPIRLWSEISNNWAHALSITKRGIKGILGRTLSHMAEHFIPLFPSIPLPYDIFGEESLLILQEAKETILRFRKILEATVKLRKCVD